MKVTILIILLGTRFVLMKEQNYNVDFPMYNVANVVSHIEYINQPCIIINVGACKGNLNVTVCVLFLYP